MIMTQKNSVEAVYGVSEQTNFRITDESSHAVIEALIDLYKFPIKTTVREIASNIADATREKQLFIQNNPGHPDLKWLDPNDEGEVYIQDSNPLLGLDTAIVFKDRGIGMSEERIRNTFTVFGASTKRGSNDLIGGYGLGAKSPLSYSQVMYVITRFNGTERAYAIARNGGSISMNKVLEQRTVALNGSEVIVPLVESKDKNEFEQAIKSELFYFEYIKKDAPQIDYEDDDMVLAWDTPYSTLSLRVGTVIYQIEKNDSIQFDNFFDTNICLKCNIGDVDLVPSREGLRYTPKTTALINGKIKRIGLTFAKKLQEHFSHTKTYVELAKSVGNNENDNRLILTAKNKIGVSGVKYKNVSLLNICNQFLESFDIETVSIRPKLGSTPKYATYIHGDVISLSTYTTYYLSCAYIVEDATSFCKNNTENILTKLADYWGNQGFSRFFIMSSTRPVPSRLIQNILDEGEFYHEGDAIKHGEEIKQRWIEEKKKNYPSGNKAAKKVFRKAEGKFIARLLSFHVFNNSGPEIKGSPEEFKYETVTLNRNVFYGEEDADFEDVLKLLCSSTFPKKVAGRYTYHYEQDKILLLQCSKSIGKGIEENGGKHISTFFSKDNPMLTLYANRYLAYDVHKNYKFLQEFYHFNQEISDLYKKMQHQNIEFSLYALQMIEKYKEFMVPEKEWKEMYDRIKKYCSGLEVLNWFRWYRGYPSVGSKTTDEVSSAVIEQLLKKTGKLKPEKPEIKSPFKQLEIFS